jgi:beta-N-acetylhexosaminidase
MESHQELAGELLTIGLEGHELTPECRDMLTAIRPGGVIFFQRNIQGAEQFSDLVTRIRELLQSRSPFLAIDMEGGTVDRFRHLIAPLPDVESAVAAGLSHQLGRLAGMELATFHLNVNYAPVLDLRLPASRNVLTTRTAGLTPTEVVKFAREFLCGMAEFGVVGCGKHFPGLGGGNLDSHIDMPSIDRSFSEMWSEDLAPYRELSLELPMVMVAHAWYPALERELGYAGAPRPASVSQKIVEGLLRHHIGYSELILCDDLEMGGVLGGRTIEEAAVDAVNAGCEVLLVCRHASNVERVHRALVNQSERSTKFRSKVEAAARHISASKRKHGIAGGSPSAHHLDLQQLREEITRFGELIETSFPPRD